MSNAFDISDYIRHHQAQLASKYRNPDAVSFNQQYGVPLSAQLTRLYSLQESLLKTPIEVVTGSGSVFVQSFVPLAISAIRQGVRYHWKYFEFAVGDEGESLLFSVERPLLICVDHSGDGSDVEETTVEIEQFLHALEIAIANS